MGDSGEGRGLDDVNGELVRGQLTCWYYAEWREWKGDGSKQDDRVLGGRHDAVRRYQAFHSDYIVPQCRD